ncbi:MAG: hypothetical protein HY554_09210, partial [Elusimicrobia bacterium]|nr:hypothetical protein [Elusimicrobiota bacterium]
MRLPLRLALAAALLAPSLGFCESVEEAKDLSGADWGESLEPTAAVQAASAPGAGASAR